MDSKAAAASLEKRLQDFRGGKHNKPTETTILGLADKICSRKRGNTLLNALDDLRAHGCETYAQTQKFKDKKLPCQPYKQQETLTEYLQDYEDTQAGVPSSGRDEDKDENKDTQARIPCSERDEDDDKNKVEDEDMRAGTPCSEKDEDKVEDENKVESKDEDMSKVDDEDEDKVENKDEDLNKNEDKDENKDNDQDTAEEPKKDAKNGKTSVVRYLLGLVVLCVASLVAFSERANFLGFQTKSSPGGGSCDTLNVEAALSVAKDSVHGKVSQAEEEDFLETLAGFVSDLTFDWDDPIGPPGNHAVTFRLQGSNAALLRHVAVDAFLKRLYQPLDTDSHVLVVDLHRQGDAINLRDISAFLQASRDRDPSAPVVIVLYGVDTVATSKAAMSLKDYVGLPSIPGVEGERLTAHNVGFILLGGDMAAESCSLNRIKRHDTDVLGWEANLQGRMTYRAALCAASA